MDRYGGLGLFIAYIPFGCIVYDDLLAVTGFVGTAGFMIYVSDAFGYLGSIGVLLYRSFGQAQLSWLQFFIGFSYVTSAFCLFCFALAWLELRKSLYCFSAERKCEVQSAQRRACRRERRSPESSGNS